MPPKSVLDFGVTLCLGDHTVRTAVRILATRCCLRYAKSALEEPLTCTFASGFGEFKARDNTVGLNRDAVRAWESGKAAMSPGLAKRIDRRAPGAELIFSALTTLLKEQRLSAPKARESVRGLWEQAGVGRHWRLPALDAQGISSAVSLKYRWDDSASLAFRRDIYGLLAILALVREAAVINSGRCQDCMRDLYVILPAACRISWIRQDIDLLLQCVEDMEAAFPWYRRVRNFGVDWNPFREEVLAPSPRSGIPPWIIDRAGGTISANPPPRRQVPLLEGIPPLLRYVRLPELKESRGSTGSSNGFARSSNRRKLFLGWGSC